MAIKTFSKEVFVSPFVSHGHGHEDGGAEGDVVQRINDKGKKVHEDQTAGAERPESS